MYSVDTFFVTQGCIVQGINKSIALKWNDVTVKVLDNISLPWQ